MARRSVRPRDLAAIAVLVTVGSLGLSACLQPGVVYKSGQSPGFAPGLWRTVGSADNTCEFARLRSLTGDNSQDAITHDFAPGGPRYIQIEPSDAGFYSIGCLPWWRQEPPGPYARWLARPGNVIPGSGDYLVGAEVAPGVYWTQPDATFTIRGVRQGPFCRWRRVSGFHGTTVPDDTAQETILAGGSAHIEVVTILPGDFGFSTTGCMPWTRIG